MVRVIVLVIVWLSVRAIVLVIDEVMIKGEVRVVIKGVTRVMVGFIMLVP
ncbi:MAG: hypothetical protein LBT86_06340 [Deltaproteobacteria bacterium]|nr:hypothetical protein [Deltaproteobacteria bacterium]